MSANEQSRARLQYPGDVRLRVLSLDRIDYRQHVHRVADRAHHHHADAIELVLRHFASSAILSPSATISDSSIGSVSSSRRLRSDLLSRAMFACRTIGSPGT